MPLIVVFFCFLALAVLGTWPVPVNLTSRIPGDAGDPILNTWILWWNAQTRPLSDAWWDAPFLFPMRNAMALSEHLLGISVFATPLQLIGASALVSYNLAFLLSFALSGFFAFILAHKLTRSTLGAWCAGLAFAFAPYRAGQIAHLQVLTTQWMPLILLGLHQYLGAPERSVRWLVLFGAAWLLEALSNGYFMLFLPALILAWLAWFVDWRRNAASGLVVLAAWGIASLPLLPILLKYRNVHAALGLARSLGDIRQFSATLPSFLHAAPLLTFWPEGHGSTQEDFLFPGVTTVVLAVAALAVLVMRREIGTGVTLRSPLLFYISATVLMWVLALGPGGESGGPPAPWRPYGWLLWLPGFESLRVPARFAMLGTLTLAVASALAISRLKPATHAGRTILGALVMTGVAVDGFMVPIPMALPPPRISLPDAPDAAVIEIPTDDPLVSAAAMYRQISHRRPILNGYTGHTPAHYAILSFALARNDTSVLTALARQRPLVIVVNDKADAGRGFRQLIEGIPGVERVSVSAAGPLFRLPVQLPATTRATGHQLSVRLSDAGPQRLQVDLDELRTVDAIQFDLRERFRELAERVLIEGSDDGQTWKEVWLGWTGEFAFEGALSDPQRVPVRIPLGDVKARYLRIYPAAGWLQTELTVFGR